MANYNSYNDYLRAAGLARLNPAESYIFEQQPRDFNVSRSFMEGMNSPYRLASTWINHIKYLPMSNTMFVRLGNSNYTYGMTPQQLSKFLTYNSLGQYYDQYIKRG